MTEGLEQSNENLFHPQEEIHSIEGEIDQLSPSTEEKITPFIPEGRNEDNTWEETSEAGTLNPEGKNPEGRNEDNTWEETSETGTLNPEEKNEDEIWEETGSSSLPEQDWPKHPDDDFWSGNQKIDLPQESNLKQGHDIPEQKNDSTSLGTEVASEPDTDNGTDAQETPDKKTNADRGKEAQDSPDKKTDADKGKDNQDTPDKQTDADRGTDKPHDGNENTPKDDPKPSDNTSSEVNQNRLDDNGKIYKDENGELLPNTEYEINGIRYRTDEKGRIISWDGDLKDSKDKRDNPAQGKAGGKDRKADDQGGHLVANMNGGSSGNENLVPMRGTVNQGDYKNGEQEENEMLKSGKTVHESGKVEYADDSSRPSKIEKTYSDGEKTVDAKYDNEKGSTDLIDDLEDDISDDDYSQLKDEINDMKADGNEVSITSVVKEYDSNGNLTSVTVGVKNETTGEKEYKHYKPNTGDNNAANS